ncbi:MAG: hypothetical protein GXP10_06515 [Gammaproteobacteria bacterium]|nr:hypothetical protein [Gammaproteobacteria bacterium]
MKKSLLMTAAAVSLSISGAAWGCGDSDMQQHVGVIAAVDHSAGTFTIIDAETRQPIEFSADNATLKTISNNQSVQVHYGQDGSGQLRAKTVI